MVPYGTLLEHIMYHLHYSNTYVPFSVFSFSSVNSARIVRGYVQRTLPIGGGGKGKTQPAGAGLVSEEFA